MFDDLPETIPQHTNNKKLKAFGATVLFQAILVASIIVVQMAMPEKLGQFQLLQTLYMAPPPPPAPAVSEAPQPVAHTTRKALETQAPAAVQEPIRPVEQTPQIVAPTSIPNDIARIVDAGPPSPVEEGARGGVPGGVAGGTPGGAFGGILGGAAAANVAPPPPTAPVRVGGNVKEPKIVHIEQPQYPAMAKRTRVQGVVVVEATVTAEGSVEKVKVISGPPLLIEAATEAVSRWKYEPTYLNGQAVPVILNARITFSLDNTDK